MRPCRVVAAAMTCGVLMTAAPPPGLAQQGDVSPPPAAVPVPAPPVPLPAIPLGPDLSFPVAVLQGLDKVTARVVTITAPVGEPVRFGALEIVARACKKRRPEDQPESAAFLDVWELRPGEPAESLFRGWMFASSPALSAMEHPVYDLWVSDCRND